MRTIHFHVFVFMFLFTLLSQNSFSQGKEYDKLKDLVDRGKLDKAKEYCDKVTAPMAPETAARFYALMGSAYYNNKEYEKSAEMLLKSEDKKLAAKLAKEFENPESACYNLKTAHDLYIVAEEYVNAAGIMFLEGEYEDAAKICNSADANYKFGKELFDKGKYTEALIFFKRAKKKGQKFKDDAVLEYYYNQKFYTQVYSVQNFGEGNFILSIQGTVIAKMIENNEPMPYIMSFLDSVGIKGSKQFEAILNGMVLNRMLEKAQEYCTEKKGSDQQACLTFFAEITAEKYPDFSAWANLKLNKTVLGKQQLSLYLSKKALEYNSNWENEPVPKNIIENFKHETKPAVTRCGLVYKDILGLAWTELNTKYIENAKKNQGLARDYSRAAALLKQVEKSNN